MYVYGNVLLFGHIVDTYNRGLCLSVKRNQVEGLSVRIGVRSGSEAIPLVHIRPLLYGGFVSCLWNNVHFVNSAHAFALFEVVEQVLLIIQLSDGFGLMILLQALANYLPWKGTVLTTKNTTITIRRNWKALSGLEKILSGSQQRSPGPIRTWSILLSRVKFE